MTAWNCWSHEKMTVPDHCRRNGCGHVAVLDRHGCRRRESAKVSSVGTSAYPPGFWILDVGDCVVAMVVGTNVFPPDFESPAAGENVRPPHSCVRVTGVGCPC